MTQKEFDALPGLLSKKQFRLVTGLERRQIHDLVRSKRLRVWRSGAGGYGKYYKSEAGQMAGFHP